MSKNHIMVTAFGYLLLTFMGANAQTIPCDDRGISTDPATATAPSGFPPYATNEFDWTVNKFWTYSPNYPDYDFTDNSPWPYMTSPFYQTNTQLDYLNNGAYSDFLWEDGWELIKRDFGFIMGGDPENPNASGVFTEPPVVKNTSQTLIAPYLILYNKFEAKLRVFGAIGQSVTGYNNIGVKLSFAQGSPNVSALLAHSRSVAQVMTDNNSVTQVTSLAAFPADKYLFFHADFPVAYDPCTCQFKSKLKVSFTLIDNMQVDLYQRFTATQSNIGSGTSGNTSHNNNYLSSLQHDPNSAVDIKAGAITYKRVKDAENRLRAIANTQTSGGSGNGWKLTLEILKTGASLAGIYLPRIWDENDYFSKEGNLANEVKAVGLVSSFASARIKTNSGGGSESSPTLIEGESVIVGTINDNDTYGWGPQFVTPGSKIPGIGNSPPNPNENNYPQYNENLGLFAVLEEPVIYYEPSTTSYDTNTEPCIQGEGPDSLTYLVKLQQYAFSGNIEYIFNPSAGINEANTQIYASLEFHSNHSWSGVKNVDRPFSLAPSSYIYASPFIPLECLSSLLIERNQFCSFDPFTCTDICLPNYYKDTAYLKLLVIYEFDQINSNGSPNRSFQIYKYPLTIEEPPSEQSLPPLISAPIDLEIGQTHYTHNQTIRAWSNIKITGDLTTNPGVSVLILAGDRIEFGDNVTVYSGITLYEELPPIVCNNPIPPITNLGTFCTNGTYQANSYARRADTTSQISAPEHAKMIIPLTAQPNPFTDELTLSYELPTEAQVQMQLVDMMGRPVRQILPTSHRKAGSHEMLVNLSDLASGMYTVILQVGEIRQTVKVVKR